MAFIVTCGAELGYALIPPDELVVYVGTRSYPSDFDPYYNQPKIYRQPRYYESTSKKTKGKECSRLQRSRTNTVTRFTKRPPLTRRKRSTSPHS